MVLTLVSHEASDNPERVAILGQLRDGVAPVSDLALVPPTAARLADSWLNGQVTREGVLRLEWKLVGFHPSPSTKAATFLHQPKCWTADRH